MINSNEVQFSTVTEDFSDLSTILPRTYIRDITQALEVFANEECVFNENESEDEVLEEN